MNFRLVTKDKTGRVTGVGLRPSRHRDRSKYLPHQSTREKERRLRQQVPESAPVENTLCAECDGKGEVLDAPGNVLDGHAYFDVCPACDGTGYAV